MKNSTNVDPPQTNLTGSKIAWLLAVAQSGVSGASVKIATVLALKYYNRNKGYAWPAIDTIASDVRMGRSAVKDGLKGLEEAGFVVKQVSRGGPKNTNQYRLDFDRAAVKEVAGATGSEISEVGTGRKDASNRLESSVEPVGNESITGRKIDPNTFEDSGIEIPIKETSYFDDREAAGEKTSSSFSFKKPAGQAKRKLGNRIPMTLDWKPAKKETIDAINTRAQSVIEEMQRDGRGIEDLATFWDRTVAAFRNHHIQRSTRATKADDWEEMFLGWFGVALTNAESDSRTSWVRDPITKQSRKVIKPKPYNPTPEEVEARRIEAENKAREWQQRKAKNEEKYLIREAEENAAVQAQIDSDAQSREDKHRTLTQAELNAALDDIGA